MRPGDLGFHLFSVLGAGPGGDAQAASAASLSFSLGPHLLLVPASLSLSLGQSRPPTVFWSLSGELRARRACGKWGGWVRSAKLGLAQGAAPGPPSQRAGRGGAGPSGEGRGEAGPAAGTQASDGAAGTAERTTAAQLGEDPLRPAVLLPRLLPVTSSRAFVGAPGPSAPAASPSPPRATRPSWPRPCLCPLPPAPSLGSARAAPRRPAPPGPPPPLLSGRAPPGSQSRAPRRPESQGSWGP